MGRQISEEELRARQIGARVMIGIVALIALIAVLSSFYTVQSGQRAIVFTWGEVTSVQDEGLRFKIPFMQTIEKVDIRTRRVESPADAVSKNLQSVNTTVTINYLLDSGKLKELYSTVGLDVETKIIAARVQETVKAVTAKYTAEELITQREQVRSDILESLTRQLLEYHVLVAPGGVQITNFNFSRAFNDSIEEKQVAEQKALTAANNLERVV